MNKIIKADLVFTNTGAPLENGAIEIDGQGTIRNIYSSHELQYRKADEEHEGILVPGFVNAHCHLELSFAAARIERHRGIDNFITRLEHLKKTIPAEHKSQAVEAALESMEEEGIVAVGDICNTPLTVEAKRKSKLLFRNFVEVYGLNENIAEEKYVNALNLKKLFDNSSIVPHSAYSLSKRLLKDIASNLDTEDIVSIHHQESESENRYFKTGDGPLAERFKRWGLTIPDFIPSGKSPAETLLQIADFSRNKTLFVHNTFSTRENIAFIKKHYRDPSFCLCPSSNLFIENTLPPLEILVDKEINTCLGTDSLASADRLSILGEMKILQKAFPFLDLTHLIPMATINGAKALGFDKTVGSFEKGKKPGIIHISEVDIKNRKLTDYSFASLLKY